MIKIEIVYLCINFEINYPMVTLFCPSFIPSKKCQKIGDYSFCDSLPYKSSGEGGKENRKKEREGES